MKVDLTGSWKDTLADELEKSYFPKLSSFVDAEREIQTIYPHEEDVFNAFSTTPYEKANVLILGQDPYHGEGQAHGMCFSVRREIKPPPSLVNIYKELEMDIPGFKRPDHGCLDRWAEQGVLLLNAVLTVRAGQPNSHKGKGWELFTDAVIKALNSRKSSVIFVFWGGYAKKKQPLIDGDQHRIITSAHPSPLSAKAGFFGSKPFSKINTALEEAGHPPIDWRL